MPLLEIVQTRHVTASIRLDEPTAVLIDQYAAFLHASADEVVDKALCYVFAKTATSKISCELRKPLMFQRAFASAASRRMALQRSLRTALQNRAMPRKPAMVRVYGAKHSGIRIPLGAAHRVNFDTPSLQGSCWVYPRILGPAQIDAIT